MVAAPVLLFKQMAAHAAVEVYEIYPDRPCPDFFRATEDLTKDWLAEHHLDVGDDKIKAVRLALLLTELLDVARDNAEWTRWRRATDSDDTERIITPQFAVGGTIEPSLPSRFNIWPNDDYPVALVTHERLRLATYDQPQQIYKGQILGWMPHGDGIAHMDIELLGRKSRPVSPDGELRLHWVDGVRAVVAAHAEFCSRGTA